MDVRKKKIINKLNKFGEYDLDNNTLIISDLSKLIDADNIFNFSIEMAKYKDLFDKEFSIVFDNCLFDFDNNPDNYYINLRHVADKISFKNCNFTNASYMVFLNDACFINCNFYSDIFVNGLNIKFDGCSFYNSSFLNAMAEHILFNKDKFNSGTSIRMTGIPKIEFKNSIFDSDSIILEDIRGAEIISSRIVSDVLKAYSSRIRIIDTDILSCGVSMSDTDMCVNNCNINSDSFIFEGDHFELDECLFCGDEICIDYSTITSICSSIITGKNICLKSPCFTIDKMSRICSDNAYLEVDDRPYKKIDSNNLKVKNVIINDNIITSDDGKYVDISLIEPRNNLIAVLKQIRDNSNEKIEILSREYKESIKHSFTVSDIENIKVLKK